MIPMFARFYGYKVTDILNEYAVVFFTLVNSMYELIAKEMLNDIAVISVPNTKDGGSNLIANLEKQAKGLDGIVREVKVVKDVRGKK